MDEQNNISSTAEPTDIPEPQEPDNIPEPQEQDAGNIQDMQDAQDDPAQPEVSINKDGDLNFSDEFWGDTFNFSSEPESKTENVKQPETQPEVTKPAENFYTDEELNTIPYENWEIDRLNGNIDIKKYANIVRQQMIMRNVGARQQLQQQQSAQPPANQPQTQNQQPPKEYTPKELANEAAKLAKKRLGLDEDAELELNYEPEHMAAYMQATQDLNNLRHAQINQYHSQQADFQHYQAFHQELSRMPDFKEFNGWLGNKLQENNLNWSDLNQRLGQYLQASGGRYSAVENLISAWVGEFRNERTQKTQPTQQVRASKPPVLETASGNFGTSKNTGTRDLRAFGRMSQDEQAKMLEQWGVV